MFVRILCIFLFCFCLPVRIYGQYSLLQITPKSKTELTLDFGRVTDVASRRLVVENSSSEQLYIWVSSDKIWLVPQIEFKGQIKFKDQTSVTLEAGEQIYLNINVEASRILVDRSYIGSISIITKREYYPYAQQLIATISVKLEKVSQPKEITPKTLISKSQPSIQKQPQVVQEPSKHENLFERIITSIFSHFYYLWIPIIIVALILVILFVRYIINEIKASRIARQSPPPITSKLQGFFNKILDAVRTFSQFLQRLTTQIKDFLIQFLDDLSQALVATFSFLFHLTSLGFISLLLFILLAALTVGLFGGVLFIFGLGVYSLIKSFF